jgi:allophanate hydrolase
LRKPTVQPLASPAAELADIPSRVAAYRAGRDGCADLDALYDRIAAEGERPVWTSVMPRERARSMLAQAAARQVDGAELPLLGVPFAVKDNIDVAGLPTTAGCPDFAYLPAQSAFCVERLVAAGAIPVGKTNLDQFATGLNGSRTPYGIPSCVFGKAHVSGGSSSGSAVAVASGLVPFALGTDTAGSGRIPAGFNNIVGLKPSRGLISTRGVVPACRTLDCVSVLATSVNDARLVAEIAAGFDPQEPYARRAPEHLWSVVPPTAFRFGVIGQDVLVRCAADVVARYRDTVATLEAQGGVAVAVDYAPFEAAAALLYAGPWVAERLAAIRGFAQARPEAIHAVVRQIILEGADYSAVDAFDGQYRLAALTRKAMPVWNECDVLLLPTAPEHPTIAAMLDAPVALNTRLGLFTNFVNLMDLAALAVPAGWGDDGLPIGVTLVGPAFSDGLLALIGDRLHRADPQARLGASALSVSAAQAVAPAVPGKDARITLAVVGAHLAGQPLNHQLRHRGAILLGPARTARGYSLYALGETQPPKPGLVRDGGAGLIEVELWSLTEAAFGAFVAEIPPPLGIGTLALDDGGSVKGFLCEPHALTTAIDITAHGGWRAYLAATTKAA